MGARKQVECLSNGWMRWTVVNDNSNFSFIHAEFPIKLTDPVFKDLTIHPTLLLCDILPGQVCNISKTTMVFLFAYNKLGSFSRVALVAAISVTLTLLFFPPVHFSSLR